VIAWSLFVLAVLLNAAGIAMATARGEPPWLILFVAAFLITPAVGAFVAARRPANAIGWLLVALGVGFSLANVMTEYPAWGPERELPLRGEAGLLGALAFWTTVNIGAIWILLLFPDGRRLPARWRYVSWLAVAELAILLVGFTVKPGDLEMPTTEMDNPFGVPELEFLSGIGIILLGITLLAAILSFIVRFRRSRGVERQQMKWVVFVAALLIATGFTLGISEEFVDPPFALELAAYGLLYAGLPATIGAAVLRYRLYDIDIIINRALVYGGLTVATVGSYVTLVFAFGWVARTLSGQGSSSLVVAATTLVVAAMFQPARRRMQATVDRRFYRSRYDAARTLEAFQARLRDQTDLESLRAELVATVEETLRPAHTVVWLLHGRTR
jgi:hypothetical protein